MKTILETQEDMDVGVTIPEKLESEHDSNKEPESEIINNDKHTSFKSDIETSSNNNLKNDKNDVHFTGQEMSILRDDPPERNEGDSPKSEKKPKDVPSVLSQFWILVPFFLLHMGAGLAGGFTSILLQHFQHHTGANASASLEEVNVTCNEIQGNVTWIGIDLTGDSSDCSQHEGDGTFMIVLATAEDYAPIVVSIVSGFLQQWLGPKMILQLTGVPAALSWILVIMGPQSKVLVVFSRFMAGLANGLLSANVYAADISHRENRQTLKMIEGASRSAGFILIYVLQLIFWNSLDNMRWISGIACLLPLLSFLGMFFRPESTVFTARDTIRRTKSQIKREKRSQTTTQKSPSQNNRPRSSTRQTGKVSFPPLGSPTIYRPLLFITGIICLQHCSGFAFTKKFLLQLLKPKHPGSDPRLATVFAIAITTIRLFANLFMARLIKSIRIRGLFFFSLFATSSSLILLGVFLDDCLDLSPITAETKKFINVVLLALHVFLVQFGLQSLSGNLTFILFPTKYKSVMKGIMRAITSVTLVILLFLLTFNVDCFIKYSYTFWVMSSILLISSPILWVIIPEVRNIGKKMATEFYRPNQTIFFLVIPKEGRVKEIETTFVSEIERKSLSKFKDLLRALSLFGTNLLELSEKIAKEEAMEEIAEDAETVTFQTSFGTVEAMLNDKEGKDENKERVSFIHNIHPAKGYLQDKKNKNKERVLIAKGPVKMEDAFGLKMGGLFLFNDVMIVSQCIRNNCRYINEKCFQLSDETFEVTRDESKISFSCSNKSISVTCQIEAEAKIWEKYVNHYKNQKRSVQKQKKKDIPSIYCGPRRLPNLKDTVKMEEVEIHYSTKEAKPRVNIMMDRRSKVVDALVGTNVVKHDSKEDQVQAVDLITQAETRQCKRIDKMPMKKAVMEGKDTSSNIHHSLDSSSDIYNFFFKEKEKDKSRSKIPDRMDGMREVLESNDSSVKEARTADEEEYGGRTWKQCIWKSLNNPTKAKELIKSIMELNDIENELNMAVTAFNYLKEHFPASTAIEELEISLEKDNSTYESEMCGHYLANLCTQNDETLSEQTRVILGNNWQKIIKKLLFTYSKEIIQAITVVCGSKKQMIQCEVYRQIKRFCQMEIITMREFKEVILKLSNNQSIHDSYYKPSDPGTTFSSVYDVILNEALPQSTHSKHAAMHHIETALNNIKHDYILQEWLFKKYEAVYKEYDVLHRNKTILDWKIVHIFVINIFFGSETHCIVKVRINNLSNIQSVIDMNNVIKIAIENMDSFVQRKITVEKPSVWGGGEISINLTWGGFTTGLFQRQQNEKKIIDKVANIIRSIPKRMEDETYKEKLKRDLVLMNEMDPNSADDLIQQFEQIPLCEMDVTKMDISLSYGIVNKVRKLHSDIPLWPYMDRKLNEIDDHKVLTGFGSQCEMEGLPAALKNELIYYIDLFRENDSLYAEVRREVDGLEEPYYHIFEKFVSNGGTFAGWINALESLRDKPKFKTKKAFDEKVRHQIINKIIDETMNIYHLWYKRWEERISDLPKLITSYTEFSKYFLDHGLASFPKMRSGLLKEKLEISDQIWVWRDRFGGYAHVCLYVGKFSDPSGTNQNHHVIHTHQNSLFATHKGIGVIKEDKLDDVIKENDGCFIVRKENLTTEERNKIRERAYACVKSESEPISFNYNGFSGNCESCINAFYGIWEDEKISLQGNEVESTNNFKRQKMVGLILALKKGSSEDLRNKIRERLILEGLL